MMRPNFFILILGLGVALLSVATPPARATRISSGYGTQPNVLLSSPTPVVTSDYTTAVIAACGTPNTPSACSSFSGAAYDFLFAITSPVLDNTSFSVTA